MVIKSMACPLTEYQVIGSSLAACFFDCHPEAAAKLSTLYLPAKLFKDAVCLHFPLKLPAALYSTTTSLFICIICMIS